MPRKVKNINVEIGARIKLKRNSQKLTRENLAELSGYSTNFIQEVERGRSGLSSESIKAFSMALGVTSDYLLFGDNTPGFEHIIAKIKTVPPEKQEQVMKILCLAIECTK